MSQVEILQLQGYQFTNADSATQQPQEDGTVARPLNDAKKALELVLAQGPRQRFRDVQVMVSADGILLQELALTQVVIESREAIEPMVNAAGEQAAVLFMFDKLLNI